MNPLRKMLSKIFKDKTASTMAYMVIGMEKEV
jgi:hypothetical protein